MEFGLVLSAVPEERLFGMDMNTVISAGANLLNVCVLAVVLAVLLYKPVRNILQKREEKIRSQFTQAEEDMAKATDLRLQYEQKMEEILGEREEILNEARKHAAETSRLIISEAKKEADALRERSAANIEMEWERAKGDMRTAIIEVSAVMAEKFVTLSMNKETHDRLFVETMADLEYISWKN